MANKLTQRINELEEERSRFMKSEINLRTAMGNLVIENDRLLKENESLRNENKELTRENISLLKEIRDLLKKEAR